VHNDGTVLVLAEQLDPTADLVVHELNSRQVPVFRFDLAAFPQRVTLRAQLDEGWSGVIEGADRAIELARSAPSTTDDPIRHPSLAGFPSPTAVGLGVRPSLACLAFSTLCPWCG
jgi:hypothetical protein